IWNAARFILMNLDGPRDVVPAHDRPFADRWILSRLNRAIREVTASLEHYRFDQASSQLYHFIWHEYCDWYLELIKPAFQSKDSVEAKRTRHTLIETFATVQRLLHPFMPFITEEIWHTLPHEGDSLVIQRYPAPIPEWDAKHIEAEFAVLEQFVTTVRTGRALLNYQPGTVLALYGATSRGEQLTTLRNLLPFIEHLGRGSVKLASLETWPADNVLRLPVEGMTVGLVVKGEVDLEKVLSRLQKQSEEKEQEIQRLEAKLHNVEFTSKAPSEVIREHGDRLRMLQQDSRLLVSSGQQLRAMMQSRKE
ncbi:MAG: class I tRNA ligase family protein, partial [Nitrospiraceae bacterium]